MKLKELKAAGGFVQSAPVEKTVEWKKGEELLTFQIHIKKHSFGTIEELLDGKNDDKSRSAAYIAASVLFDGGKERLTYDDAYALEPKLAAVFIRAINEVNGTGDAPKS